MWTNRARACFVLLVLAGCAAMAPGAYAIDHSNLDEDRPLRLEDPYPVARGEWALEAGVGMTRERRSRDRGLLAVEVLHGTFVNAQLSAGTLLSTDSGALTGQERSGDLHLSGLYNFNQETLKVPALGVKLTASLPTGVGSAGTDIELKGLLTCSVGRLALHLNLARQFLAGEGPGERGQRYTVLVGASYPPGAPWHTRLTIVGDLFLEQAPQRGERRILGAETGIRYQGTARLVMDAGIGSEFQGPEDRSPFFLRVGLSTGF